LSIAQLVSPPPVTVIEYAPVLSVSAVPTTVPPVAAVTVTPARPLPGARASSSVMRTTPRMMTGTPGRLTVAADDAGDVLSASAPAQRRASDRVLVFMVGFDVKYRRYNARYNVLQFCPNRPIQNRYMT
jgi:hypothetical protein